MKEKKDIKVYSLSNENHPDKFFKIEKMEDHYDDVSGTIDEPHSHDFYTIIWLNQGNGSHTIDFKKYSLAENQIYFLNPGQVHQIATDNRPEGWVLSFSVDFLILNNIPLSFIENINLFRPYNESPPLRISSSLSAQLQSLVEDMISYFENSLPFKNEALGAQLRLLLIYCNTECNLPQPLESNESCILVDFRRDVENEFRISHKVGEYAEKLSITPKYLNEVIKGSLGYTAKEYILDRIIIEAKRLLLHSEMSAKQIAYELGFKEAVHFSAFFKKITGLTPIMFKDSNIQREF